MRGAIFYIFSFLFVTAHLTSAAPNPLDSFRWDYRIILVSIPAADVEDIVSELGSARDAINERHILWFVVGGESVATNYAKALPKGFQAKTVKQYHKEASGETAVRLIGKDGGVKEMAESFDLDRLFLLIDSMPMRQAEMKKN